MTRPIHRTLFWLALLAAMAAEIAAVKAFGQMFDGGPLVAWVIPGGPYVSYMVPDAKDGYRCSVHDAPEHKCDEGEIKLFKALPPNAQCPSCIPKPPPNVKKKKLEGYWGSGDWNMGLPRSERKP